MKVRAARNIGGRSIEFQQFLISYVVNERIEDSIRAHLPRLADPKAHHVYQVTLRAGGVSREIVQLVHFGEGPNFTSAMVNGFAEEDFRDKIGAGPNPGFRDYSLWYSVKPNGADADIRYSSITVEDYWLYRDQGYKEQQRRLAEAARIKTKREMMRRSQRAKQPEARRRTEQERRRPPPRPGPQVEAENRSGTREGQESGARTDGSGWGASTGGVSGGNAEACPANGCMRYEVPLRR